MSKLYISGKITGTDDYIEKFGYAEESLLRENHTVINPVSIGNVLPSDTSWEEYMSIDLCLIDMCDAIYMLKDWNDSKGACMELGYAIAKGLDVIFEE